MQQIEYRKIKKACLPVMVAFLLLILSSCQDHPKQTTPTQTPTVINPTGTGPITQESTTRPSGAMPGDLQPIEPYPFKSDQKIELPDGLWLDAGPVDPLNQVKNLVVTTTGQGRPTLTQKDETKPILVLESCTSITFHQIRIGYDQPDWPDEVNFTQTPLVQLKDSTNIIFEDCEFFGGTGMALLLDGCENIILKNCTFYNNAGPPLATSGASTPSQIRAEDCLFETISSGVLPLNIDDSVFIRCEWIGRKGYLVPLAAENEERAVEILARGTKSLPQRLKGILACRVTYLSDESGQVICRDNLFASREVLVLFDQLEQNLKNLLPDAIDSFALTGQKAEEAAPGQPLDSTLGLYLALQTNLDTEPVLSATENNSEEQTTPEPTTRHRLYDINRLIEELDWLNDLNDLLEPIITGQICVDLNDQNQQPLLTVQIPITDLRTLLNPSRPDQLIDEGRIVLHHPELIPADFCLRENAGSLSVSQLIPALNLSFDVCDTQKILPMEGGHCQIQSKLSYEGTTLTQAAAQHHFCVQIERILAGSEEETWESLTFCRFIVFADTGDAVLLEDENKTHITFPDEELAQQIRSALQSGPIQTELSDGKIIPLKTLAAYSEDGSDCLPVMILHQDESVIDLRTVLYDDQYQPQVVAISLIHEKNQWMVESCKIQTSS